MIQQRYFLPLIDNEGKFLQMKETFLEEGASSTFGEDYNFEGKKLILKSPTIFLVHLLTH